MGSGAWLMAIVVRPSRFGTSVWPACRGMGSTSPCRAVCCTVQPAAPEHGTGRTTARTSTSYRPQTERHCFERSHERPDLLEGALFRGSRKTDMTDALA